MIVVIPTMYMSHLDYIFNNHYKIDLSEVEKIYIFNNSENNFTSNIGKIHIFNLGSNIGVNAVWNSGLKLAEALDSDVMFLNDDVYFKEDFFSKTKEALSDNRSFAVICPYAMKTKEDFDLGFKPDYERRYAMMRKRNGWAFTINKKFLPTIPIIPREMNIFFGDDWIWGFTRQLWIKDNENIIYHQVGKTLKKNKRLRALYHQDKKAFSENIKRLRER